jgi:hypothetical protein
MTSPLLRIVLAMYLAIVSPAMCCCDFKAVMGRVTGMHVDACMMKAPQHEMAGSGTAPSCCAHRAAAKAAQTSDQRSDSAPCRCHESMDSHMRLDTGAKVTLPAAIQIDTLPAMMPVAIAMTDTVLPEVHASWGGHRAGVSPWPCATLVAQHCLLLL